MTDPRWVVLEQTNDQIVVELAHERVRGVQVVAAFPTSNEAWIWLCTQTDDQRDRVPQTEPHLDVVKRLLSTLGYPADSARAGRATGSSCLWLPRTCLTQPEQRRELPDELAADVILVDSGADLLAVIANC